MRKQASFGVLGLLGLGMMLVFQNCGDQLPDTLYSSSLSSNEIYDLKVDQLAYMSCSEQKDVPNDQNVFFTFRVGAYNDGAGLHLTDSFLHHNRTKKKAAMMNLIMDDAIVGGSQIQFALRKQSDLGLMFVGASNSNEGIDGVDYDFTMGLLGSEEMTAALLTTNSTFSGWLNYWPTAGVTYDAYFEGTMTYNESEIIANQVRNFLTTGGGVITTAFADPSKPANIRVPDYTADDDRTNDDDVAPTNVGLGSGLKVSFKQPTPLNWNYTGTPHVNMPKRVLASVTEYDLASGSSQAAWECPTRLQLRIIYPTDTNLNDSAGVGNPVCVAAADPSVLTGDLAVVRNSLPAADWYVDLSRRCVIPRRSTVGSCYGVDSSTQNTRDINYRFTSACNPAVVSKVGSTITNVCPHFISICYKNP